MNRRKTVGVEGDDTLTISVGAEKEKVGVTFHDYRFGRYNLRNIQQALHIEEFSSAPRMASRRVFCMPEKTIHASIESQL
jgi:hypothetical protein